MIKAVIFDMDGLLFDTEPHWQATERKIFGSLGIEITEEMQKETFGLRADEQIRYWYSFRPWKDPDFSRTEDQYHSMMIKYYHGQADLMEGAVEALEFIRSKGLPMALASSSNMQLINAFLDKFSFHPYFKEVYSAEFEKFGKPHPAVYLETARRLNVNPFECLALEDSFHGVIAAKAARMKTIAVPAEYDVRFEASDVVLNSLLELNDLIIKRIDITC